MLLDNFEQPFFPVFSGSTLVPRVLHLSLRPSAQEGHGPVRTDSEKGHEKSKHLSCDKRLTELRFTLEKSRQAPGRLTTACQYIKEVHKAEMERLFTRSVATST